MTKRETSDNAVISASTIILDIEGTTTSISFVKDTLFPYVRSSLEAFLNQHWDTASIQEVVNALQLQAKEDEDAKLEGVVAIPQDKEKDILMKSVIDNVLWQMDNDRKTKSLKDLQGLVMEEGYKKGDLKGHIYDDVEPSLKSWVASNKSVYIYSSGSVHAQKLLFGHSVKGDLLPFLKGHFDTTVGMKGDATSYKNILQQISCEPCDTAFLTDVPKEAKAAKEAGLSAILLSRDGNAPLADEDRLEFPVVTSFTEIEFETTCKKRKLCTENHVENKNKTVEACSVSLEDKNKPHDPKLIGDSEVEAMEVDETPDSEVASKSETEEQKDKSEDTETEVRKNSEEENKTSVPKEESENLIVATKSETEEQKDKSEDTKTEVRKNGEEEKKTSVPKEESENLRVATKSETEEQKDKSEDTETEVRQNSEEENKTSVPKEESENLVVATEEIVKKADPNEKEEVEATGTESKSNVNGDNHSGCTDEKNVSESNKTENVVGLNSKKDEKSSKIEIDSNIEETTKNVETPIVSAGETEKHSDTITHQTSEVEEKKNEETLKTTPQTSEVEDKQNKETLKKMSSSSDMDESVSSSNDVKVKENVSSTNDIEENISSSNHIEEKSVESSSKTVPIEKAEEESNIDLENTEINVVTEPTKTPINSDSIVESSEGEQTGKTGPQPIELNKVKENVENCSDKDETLNTTESLVTKSDIVISEETVKSEVEDKDLTSPKEDESKSPAVTISIESVDETKVPLIQKTEIIEKEMTESNVEPGKQNKSNEDKKDAHNNDSQVNDKDEKELGKQNGTILNGNSSPNHDEKLVNGSNDSEIPIEGKKCSSAESAALEAVVEP